MSSNEVATLQSVQERVKERIQAQFMELLPPEMFQAMVKTALDSFVANELPALVRAEAREHLKKALAAEFTRPEWMERWDGRKRASEMAQTIARECAPELVQAMFSGVVQAAVIETRNSIQRY